MKLPRCPATVREMTNSALCHWGYLGRREEGMIPEPGNLPCRCCFGTSVERGAETGVHLKTPTISSPFRFRTGAFYIWERSNGKIILVTGGARSGKSNFSEKLALGFGRRSCYLATAQTLDSEMQERVKDAPGAARNCLANGRGAAATGAGAGKRDGKYQAILVDCITLWLSNLLFKYEDSAENCTERIHEDRRLKRRSSGW